MDFFCLFVIKKHMSKRVRNTVVPFNAQEVTRRAPATRRVPVPNTQAVNEALAKENFELRAALLASTCVPAPLPVPVAAVPLPRPITTTTAVVYQAPIPAPVTTTPVADVHVARDLPALEPRPATAYARVPISEIRVTTDFTHLAVYGRVVEVSPITNKPVQGGHRQLWWIWIVDMSMSIQVSIWSGVGTPRGDPPLIPRVGEVVNMTGFSGVLSNGQWDKWHPCQLQAEHTDLKFAYPGADPSLLWDKQLNPARTIQAPSTPEKKVTVAAHAGFVMEASPRALPQTVESTPPLARVLKVGGGRFCTDCGQALVGATKHCAETGKPH